MFLLVPGHALATGAKIEDGSYIPFMQTIYPGQKIEVESCPEL